MRQRLGSKTCSRRVSGVDQNDLEEVLEPAAEELDELVLELRFRPGASRLRSGM